MASAIKELISQYTFYHSIYLEIAVAIITFFIVIIIGKLMLKFLAKLLEISNFDHRFKDITGIETLLAERIGSFGKAVLYLVAVGFGLNHLDLPNKVYLYTFILIVLVSLLAVSLRIKDFIPNFYHGLKLKPKRYLKKGNRVRMKNILGRVRKVKANGILVETDNKDILFVPNLSLTVEELKRSKS